MVNWRHACGACIEIENHTSKNDYAKNTVYNNHAERP
jgi:hypothetical protein